MGHALNSVFNPRSVAVIGASEVPGKAAERRTRSLIRDGYGGQIYLVNPKRERLFDRKAYPSILDVDGPVDLAMIVVAPRFITQAVEECVRKGAKGIVIITAGLGESGPEGKKIEARILEIAATGGTRILGPNCSGLFSAASQMNLLGVPTIQQGPLAIIAQSGNIIDSLTHYSKMRGIGCNSIISAGNAIGVKFHEYLEYLGEDEETRVILLYMEGIQQGAELVRVARKVTRQKPVIALKVGRTLAGARAAASHTGSMAADDSVVEAAFRQAGILRATNVDEMFDLAAALVHMPLPRGRRVAIISEGGGDNSVAADNAERHGLQVPVLEAETQQQIRPYLLPGMPASNPIDYGGTAEENPDMINRIAEVLMQSDEDDSIYITGFFGGFKEIIAPHVGVLEERTAEAIADLMRTYQKPVAVHTCFAHEPFRSLEILKQNGIFLTPSSERAAECLACMGWLADYRRTPGAEAADLTAPAGIDAARASGIVTDVKRSGRRNLLETEARDLLAAFGIALPPAELAHTAAQAVTAAETMACPVALKIVSTEILHKSDAGGVALNRQGAGEVAAAFDEIMQRAAAVTSLERIAGILVTPMAQPGEECIVGMVRNPQFGPVLMFGLGGIFVEVLKDVAFRVLPATRHDLLAMVREIKGYPLLAGIRGRKPKDTEVLIDLLLRVAAMAEAHPQIKAVDLNPVIVHEKGASVVDARIILE